MTVESSQNNPAITEAAVNQAAESMIQANCIKHGITRDQFPADGVEEARRVVRQEMEAGAALKSNPLYAQLEAEREAHRLTKMQMDAIKQTRITPTNNVQPVANVALVRGQLGERDWHALTDNGRLMACGIDPKTVTPVEIQEAKKLFGRGVDSHFSSNFAKQDKGRYRHLKNVAIVLGLQGK